MSLKLTYKDVYSRIGEYLGVGSAPTGSDLLAVKNIVKRGYRRFLMPIDASDGKGYSWKFLERTTTLSVVANKSTYDLPAGFNGIVGQLRYTTPLSVNPVQKDLDFVIERNSLMTGTGYPIYYAIQTGNFDKINGQPDRIMFHPVPCASLDYYYTYIFTPSEPIEDNDVFVGDESAAEAILEICLAVAEQGKYDTPNQQNPNVHSAIAEQLLQMAIGNDKGKRLVPNMGQITDGIHTKYTRTANIFAQDGRRILP
jgi:hypothetical protein